ncbi:PREDICTED: uncharacterized protein LOC104723729 isoform X1 [Camelina sativa]|uniref:Uncharacterized protein LOC104723729 isoform X1 n=1 Tax=Camelina sativa TaxID=90675 RepID=A0ABM1QPB7_CAMSA|nr:PREDICTED: uncharacterized protein LOC104723729 isoform X1 [Camelina sativa]XP_010440426.1 PREDICTED: uncharacterized protein LOC104723729 isoform X1 [Camelina sativa]XP_010440427.1 PREDICTED: uncharacterized protein LOC104723729 isoform X1 [Camelina sativa]XP_019088605.1 PREDICTED: uncharacterized protein LOC104723729 isoform X1 [Camelina sativa]XP_019088606.1 PREDICTED: uncharacterized protein LOC104723729 isoform X1 [Camelina sativa]
MQNPLVQLQTFHLVKLIRFQSLKRRQWNQTRRLMLLQILRYRFHNWNLALALGFAVSHWILGRMYHLCCWQKIDHNQHVSLLTTLHTNCSMQSFSIRREKRLMKQSKFSKTWKFKFKNMAMSTNRSQMDHNIGLVRKKKRFQNLRMKKQAHMSRVMSKMRMLHDPRGMKQLLHGDTKLMFLCQVESGEATTLTLKEAVSELIFQGFKVLTAYPKVYGKLQLQNRLAMDIPEYAVSLTRVHAVNTIFQDRDATLMTWFIHGDAQFQVYHKWRSKPLLFWSLICIQFVHKTKPATSLISRIHKESVNFHIGDPWSDCDLVVLIASKGVAATIGHSLYIMTYYSAYQVWDVMLQLGFRVHQLLKRPKLSISWKYKLKLMVIWLEDISVFHHSLGMGNKVVIGLYTRQKVQVRDHLWLTTNADLLLYLSANLIQVSLLQLHHTQCGLICRMVNWLIECELQGTNTR